MADISKEDLQKHIKEIVTGANLASLTSRVVRTQLEEKLGIQLLSRKKEIDELLMAEIEEANASGSEEEEQSEEEFEPEKAAPKKGKKKAEKKGSDDSASESEDEYAPKAKKSPKKKPAPKRKKGSDDSDDDDWNKRKAPKKTGKRGGPKQSAFTKSFKLSEELADVVGENVMPRHLVVKKLWAVIKERNLQDPKNKQYAICDDQLMKIFGIKRFRTFGMMKHLKDHFIEAA